MRANQHSGQAREIIASPNRYTARVVDLAQAYLNLVEQLEASQRHHEAAVVKIHLVEGRADQLRYALRDAMAFIQPEVAGDYHLWESLVAGSNPAKRQDDE